MRILSVIPAENGQSTTINAIQDGHPLMFVYSDIYELIYDPFDHTQWCQWNGGTLTEAISWIIALYMPQLSPKGDY